LKLITRNNTLQTLADNPMQDALLSKFSKVMGDVLFNSKVNNIAYSGEKITITGVGSLSGESFSEEVDKVIVTVPLSILKSGNIGFTPQLPSPKVTALSRMDMDPMFRVLLDFKANFWGETSGFLYGGIDGPEYFNSGAGRSDVNRTMSVTVGGAKAAALSQLGKGAIPVLLAELDTIFDGKATSNIREDINGDSIAIIQDWSLDPHIKGGASYVKPGYKSGS
jgi:monoamine oxidase